MAWRGRPITGPVETGYWGAGATDLGILRDLGNGEMIAVFGDTFAGGRVGEGDWRSPCGLIGTKGADGHPVFSRAAGTDPKYARQFWWYPHNNPDFSTVLPSDVVRLPDGALILHVMVAQGLGNCRWTELWRSTDNGRTWGHLGLKIAPHLNDGKAVMWTMELGDDGFVYIYSGGWRDRGLVMHRVHWNGMNNLANYQPWKWTSDRGWHWGEGFGTASEILPGRWGELNLRKFGDSDRWVLTAFNAANGRVEARVFHKPWSNLHTAPVTTLVRNGRWEDDGRGDICSQPYGGYVVPGSTLDTPDGFKVAVSQWNTDNSAAGPAGWPYRVLAYHATVPSRMA